MKVRDVMTQRVVSVEPDASVLQAARLMLQNKVSGLPVIDKQGRVVGIVSEGDFLRRSEIHTQRRRARWLEFLIGPGRLADEYVRACGRKVNEIMTRDVLTVEEDTPLDRVVELMERHRIKRTPVVRDQHLVGIVSRANLLHALASVASGAKTSSLDDAAIRERLLDELKQQPWAPLRLINVVVRDGIVELWGEIVDERERQALIVAAENIPGVKDVRDYLAWVEPTSGMVFYNQDEEARAKAS